MIQYDPRTTCPLGVVDECATVKQGRVDSIPRMEFSGFSQSKRDQRVLVQKASKGSPSGIFGTTQKFGLPNVPSSGKKLFPSLKDITSGINRHFENRISKGFIQIINSRNNFKFFISDSKLTRQNSTVIA